MSRLTSDFFAAALIRTVTRRGDFAAILKRGASQAGAIFICVRARAGHLALYAPAPQQAYDDSTERLFIKNEIVVDDASLEDRMIKEGRFDTDYWLIELELSSTASDLPFTLMRE